MSVAKLREALAEMTAFWDAHGCAYSVQVAPVRESKEVVEAERVRVMAKARAALAEPERNCDLFDDDDDAFAAWHDSLVDGDVVCVRNGFRWLFAQATQEGGDHVNGPDGRGRKQA